MAAAVQNGRDGAERPRRCRTAAAVQNGRGGAERPRRCRTAAVLQNGRGELRFRDAIATIATTESLDVLTPIFGVWSPQPPLPTS